jgi:hypothetical protein
MPSKPPSEKKRNEERETIPFDDALRRLLNTPPKHKTAKTKKKTGS